MYNLQIQTNKYLNTLFQIQQIKQDDSKSNLIMQDIRGFLQCINQAGKSFQSRSLNQL
ncbi:unnamed protein product [Paramecium octaurelia]|uniref:Uncharacterized protein n=1 Tax=Paramecium octaurelia TaxID=43137 RepID=A0A8S1YRE3_PAROT|nr:unnamed protein product [Paramecium octaurelia]